MTHGEQAVVDVVHYRCTVCDMSLWNPIAQLGVTVVGLYDDARFPGRCILMLDRHTEALDRLAEPTVLAMQRDLVALSSALRTVTHAERINYAVLGNAEPHLHWHVIPRYPHLEAKPRSSPWDDPRPSQRLEPATRERLISSIRDELTVRTPTPASHWPEVSAPLR